MRTILVAALSLSALLAATGMAQAEDNGVVMDDSYDWEGGYVGVFAGYGWGTASWFFPLDDDVVDVSLSGCQLGVRAGADVYLSSNVVGGIVGDIATSDICGSFSREWGGMYYTFSGTWTYSIDWEASLRARLGLDSGAFLPYITGGLAVADASLEYEGDGGDNSASATHIGWTVGAGAELALSDNVTVDILYRYNDYGSEEYEWTVTDGWTNPTIDLTSHVITAGLNLRF